ncbi:extracellular mutant protein 11-domain-containing protein [Parachaetomium inaequale]|uniref:Extracellular mutant protein 11-domain-containing protein n=1 Tax=Parachaetomium inaequale TaxID=2588326 RepID=A0AAN6PH30_9PEZI|nr:extracellular mutant protein 11-domain-containing protein [Parachaetomium inaequale]
MVEKQSLGEACTANPSRAQAESRTGRPVRSRRTKKLATTRPGTPHPLLHRCPISGRRRIESASPTAAEADNNPSRGSPRGLAAHRHLSKLHAIARLQVAAPICARAGLPMRLSMMPTTKKKLGSIGLFMRQADGSVGGPQTGGTSSPRAAGVGLSAVPGPGSHSVLPGAGPGHATASATGHSQLPQLRLQPPHEIIAARQERQLPDTPATAAATASARSIPTPRAGRYAASAQPTATMSLPAQHFHPMQRTRTSASDTARDAQRGPNAWEDSTVASMFGDNESRAASERLRVPQGGHARHYSDAPPPQRALPAPPARTQPKHDENLPFVIGENGVLKVLPPSSAQKASEPAPGPVAPSATPGGIFDDQSVKQDDAYHEARQIFETPTKASGLRRTKLAYRDNRDLKSNASSERAGPGYSPESQSVSLSPERQAEVGGHIDKIRLQERMSRDRERQRERDRERERERERQREQEREIQHKRSTIFENLTPLELDDPDFNDTKAAVAAPSTSLDPEALKEALQRTPRANRQQQHQQLQQLFAPQNNLLLPEAPPPLGRTASRRREQKSPTKEPPPPTTTTTTAPTNNSRKRRQSLDYNDAELHAMSYANLRSQAFDFDPQTAALQQTSLPPAGGTIEERLEHYKGKGSMDQHEFFARLPLDEWDEAGDWFLARFGGVMQRLRQARKTKRGLVQQFEEEVAAREEAVRGKIEGIGRTLEELREEGMTMMEGKDVDVEF